MMRKCDDCGEDTWSYHINYQHKKLCGECYYEKEKERKMDKNKDYIKPMEKDIQQDGRVEEWREFSVMMEQYIEENTYEKYGKGNNNSIDLMMITNPSSIVWCILKYAWRLYKRQGKRNDIQKIAHYACILFCKVNGDVNYI